MNACDKNISWFSTKPSNRILDKLLKTYIISLESSNSKFHLSTTENPSPSPQTCIVIQANIPLNSPVTVEFQVLDNSNSKRKILFTPSVKEISKSQQSLKLPSLQLFRGSWTNFKFDLEKWTTFGFSSGFKTLENINISGILKLSKIFVEKNDPRSSETQGKTTSSTFFNFQSQKIAPESFFSGTPAETRSKSTKRSLKRPPITTAPVEQLKRVTFVNKNQGKTATGFFMKSKNEVSPLKIQETWKDSRKGSSSSRRHSLGENIDTSFNLPAKEKPLPSLPAIRGSVKKTPNFCINREKSPLKSSILEKSSLKSPILENLHEKKNLQPSLLKDSGKTESQTQRFTDFQQYPNSFETMSNSIEEEIEVESCQVDDESHHFYAKVLQDSHKKPTFFLNELAKATEMRPFTPPFELYDKYSEIEEDLPKLDSSNNELPSFQINPLISSNLSSNRDKSFKQVSQLKSCLQI